MMMERKQLHAADAFDRVKEDAVAGDIRAIHIMATVLTVSGDPAEGGQCFRRAADAGDTDAMVRLAQDLDQRGQIREGASMWLRAADAGDIGAIGKLMMEYERSSDPARAER
jgi:hypothetical protein